MWKEFINYQHPFKSAQLRSWAVRTHPDVYKLPHPDTHICCATKRAHPSSSCPFLFPLKLLLHCPSGTKSWEIWPYTINLCVVTRTSISGSFVIFLKKNMENKWMTTLTSWHVKRRLCSDCSWMQSKQWNYLFEHVSRRVACRWVWAVCLLTVGTHTRACIHTHNPVAKARWANLLSQQDEASLVSQRLHGAQTDAVEKYYSLPPQRQTHDTGVCVNEKEGVLAYTCMHDEYHHLIYISSLIYSSLSLFTDQMVLIK